MIIMRCLVLSEMRITATTKEGDIYPLDVSNELLLSDLKALLEAEIGIPLQEMLIIHNMAPINQNHIMLRDCGIQDGDMLLITKMDPNEIQSQFVYSEGNSQSKNQPQDGLPNVDWRSIQIPGIHVYTCSGGADPILMDGPMVVECARQRRARNFSVMSANVRVRTCV